MGGGISVEPFEALLRKVIASPRRSRKLVAQAEPQSRLDKLSPGKRALLALRLAKRPRHRKRGFHRQTAEQRDSFAFHPPAPEAPSSAIGGTLPGFAVSPVRLPGRENRLDEPPFDRIEPLVKTVADAIRPHLTNPYVLFGHSAGAGRELWRSSLRANCGGGINHSRQH